MIFGIIVMVIMGLCFVGVIVGIVMIGKWSDEAMDRIMELEEEKRRWGDGENRRCGE